MNRWLVAILIFGAALPAQSRPRGARVPKFERDRNLQNRRQLPPRDKATASANQGEVTYLTSTHAYLSRGESSGLGVGAKVTFASKTSIRRACTIDAASAHWSRCATAALRLGDRFVLTPLKSGAEAASPPPITSDEVQIQWRSELDRSPWLLTVDRRGTTLDGLDLSANAALSHTTYSNLASSAGPHQIQRVDVGAFDVEIYRGLRASIDASVWSFSRRPATFRSTLRNTPVLVVRQLEVSFRRSDVSLFGKVGRTWLHYAPGLLTIDGAQAGWHRQDNAIETGIFGGLLPNASSMAFDSTQWALGAFAMGRIVADRSSIFQLTQFEARAGWAVKNSLGGRFEVGLAAHAYAGRRFDAHAVVELGLGATQGPGALDAARLYFGWRPIEAVRVLGGARYRGVSPNGIVEIGSLSSAQRTLHADMSALVDASSRIWIGISGGVATDFASSFMQARVGPELTLSSLLGRGGGVSIGYAEEAGWIRGRNAWLQGSVLVASRVRVLARTQWFQQQFVANTAGLTGNELGALVSIDVGVFRWLSLRAFASGRMQVEDVSKTAGLVSAQIVGQL